MAQSAALTPVFHDVAVLESWDETKALRGLRLDLGSHKALHRRPGQVLRVRAPGGVGEGWFALATHPDEPHTTILVKRGGGAADATIASATPGARLAVAGPLGPGFPVEELAGRDVLLFAAGSGISPIRALIEHIGRHRPTIGRVALWYGQREVEDVAFRGDVPAWERAGVRVTLCLSRPGPGWTGGDGWVQDVASAELWGGIDPTEAVAFAVGMKAMGEAVRGALERAGLPRSRVFSND